MVKFDFTLTKITWKYFYQDTSDAHAYVSNKNKHLRRTLDKKNDGSTVISEFNYELDRAGIRLSMTDKDEKYNAYNYDPLYQLKAETKWSQKVGGARDYQYAYVFDPNGNRIVEHHDGVVKGFVYGDNNEMLSAGGVDFTYDHFGNTKTKVDGSGTTTYNYDFENHLINVDFPNTANDDDHEYDGVGRRMRSKLNGAGDWTNFVFDEMTDNLIAEYTLITGTFTIKSLNTWGIGLISTNREGTKRYFHFDGLGSTVALTDFDMNVTDSYVYSAFGITESSTGSSVNPFRFVGQWGYYDDGARGSQSGLLLLGVRYYSPEFGRFWSWDPISSINAYSYALNDAINLVDDSGNEPSRKQDKVGCRVYDCQHQDFIGHSFICVEGPTGGCSGGAYPPSSIRGYEKGDKNYANKCSSLNKDKDLNIKCKLISTDCAYAGHVCACLKSYEYDYWFGGFCHGFTKGIQCCGCYVYAKPGFWQRFQECHAEFCPSYATRLMMYRKEKPSTVRNW